MRNRLASLLVVGATAIAPIALAAPDQKPTRPTIEPSRGRLGVAVLQISPELRVHFGAPRDRGVLVDGVQPKSPAERAGMQVGDLVLEVDGDPTRSGADILDAMTDRKRGEQISIDVLRAGKRMQLTPTLRDDPSPRRQSFDDRFDRRLPPMMDRGIQRDLDDARRRIEELEKRLQDLERT